MKRYILLLFVQMTLFQAIAAQHCPFDGKSIVFVKVEGSRKCISNLRLEEIDNPVADSCKYEPGLLTMYFSPIDSIYDENSWIKDYEKRQKKTKLKKKGHFFVSFGMAASSCMLTKNNQYVYQKRKFCIKYESKLDGRTHTATLDNNMIFSMCTSAGSWQRFEAVKIK